MEAKELSIAGDEFDMLCAEILENWNSPNLGNNFFLNQNPFSQFNPTSNDDIIQGDSNTTLYNPLQPSYCTINVETKNEGPEHKEDKTMKILLSEHKEDKTMKTTDYEKEDDDDSDDDEDDLRIILDENDANNPPSQQCNLVIDRPVPDTSRSCSLPKFKFVPPFNKTIFDTNIDHMREKLWRYPGVDMSDFFNYGLDEKKWKDYCKLVMRTQAQARNASRQSTMTADKNRQSRKEVKVDRAKKDKCLKLAGSKDPRIYDSNVIIEIAIRDSVYEKTSIKGENILPFPMDSYSDEYLKFDAIALDMAIDDCLNYADSEDLSLHDSDVIIEIVFEKAQTLSDSENTAQPVNYRMIKGDKIFPFPMDSYTLAKYRDKKRLWRKKARDYHSLRQENRKRAAKFNDTISHQKIEEDPEKLKKRRERFEVPLPNVKNGVVANKPNILNQTTDSNIKNQRRIRRRKWRNS